MNPIQTGIAVALALGVIVLFFILPVSSFFGGTSPSTESEFATSTINMSNTQSAPSNMPTEQPVTQLMIQDETTGTGPVAATGDSVTVNYVGSLTNGTVFDASANHGSTGFTFNLGAGQVIKGWDQGIVGMKVGGKRKLTIPADLAYGSQAIGNVIPANSALVFEVELLNVVKPTH